MGGSLFVWFDWYPAIYFFLFTYFVLPIVVIGTLLKLENECRACRLAGRTATFAAVVWVLLIDFVFSQLKMVLD